MDAVVAAWRERVPGDPKNFEELTTRIAARDREVRSWIESYLKGAIIAGIGSCVTRESDSLAIPVPSAYVAAHAFASYIQTLEATGLTVDLAINAQGPETSLLLMNPGCSGRRRTCLGPLAE